MSMQLVDAEQLADSLMQQHGLTPKWRFGFNHARRQLGICRFTSKRIELSRHMVTANTEAEVRETLLHEIAHALAGHRAGHGPKWRAICLKIGAKPQRCDTQAQMPKGRWRAVCGSCGREHDRHRRPMKDRSYYCRRCGMAHGELTFALKDS